MSSLRRPSRTTRPILLDRWTRHRAVRAENATVTRLWFKSLAASLAVIEELASVGWHLLGRLMTAFRAGNCGNGNHRPNSEQHGSVNGLTRYHPSHAASRVLHVALTTRDQVNMGVANSLSGSITTIHTNVEAAHRRVLLRDLVPKPVQ